MTEKELKDEIKRLKDKLTKKNLRLKEVSTKLTNAETRRKYWYQEHEKSNELYWAIRKNFPEKFYKVEWSGVNELGNRNPSTIELLQGVCAKHVIQNLNNKFDSVKIHMIEEVAT